MLDNHGHEATKTGGLPKACSGKMGPQILVIDDEAAIRALLRQVFEGAGYSVTEAPDGIMGLHVYRTAPTDLVITDIHMPKQGGFWVIRELRAACPTLPIFAISGAASAAGADPLLLARQLGASRTFSKPFVLREVLSAVHEVLQTGTAL